MLSDDYVDAVRFHVEKDVEIVLQHLAPVLCWSVLT